MIQSWRLPLLWPVACTKKNANSLVVGGLPVTCIHMRLRRAKATVNGTAPAGGPVVEFEYNSTTVAEIKSR